MKHFKLFTINAPEKETNEDGSATSYQINKFLNEEEIDPMDISAEFNENSGKVLVSIAYHSKAEKPLIQSISDMLGKRKKYQVRFVKLGDYREQAHTIYLQKALEDVIHASENKNISHGLFVEDRTAKVVLLELQKHNEE